MDIIEIAKKSVYALFKDEEGKISLLKCLTRDMRDD